MSDEASRNEAKKNLSTPGLPIQEAPTLTLPPDLSSPLLYLVVFLSGAGVLMLELVGPRLISPFLGQSHYVWASIISVTLLSLATGYAGGGWLADRRPAMQTLQWGLLGGAITTACVPWLKNPVLGAIAGLDPRLGSLLASLALFAIPLTFLGMVSPAAARVKVSGVHDVGRTVGGLYAVSTLGSVVGALLTSFVLIPNWALSTVTGVTAFVMLFSFALTLTARPRSPAKGAVATLAFLGGLAPLFASGDPVEVSGARVQRLIYVDESPHAQIKVVDDRGKADSEDETVRHLLINGTVQTMFHLASQTSASHYTYALQLVRAFRPLGERVLVIGLGGGALTTALREAGLDVTVVELDGALVPVAREYFSLRDEQEVQVVDGRVFVEQAARPNGPRFDFILIDAFSTFAIPESLTSTEAFAAMKRCLRPGGVIGMNVTSMNQGPPARIWRSVVLTLQEHFAHTRVYDVRWWREVSSSNFLVFASADEMVVTPGMDLSLRRDPSQNLEPQHREMRKILRRKVLPYEIATEGLSAQGALVLRDDYNPINFWQLESFQAFRQQILEYYAPEILLN